MVCVSGEKFFLAVSYVIYMDCLKLGGALDIPQIWKSRNRVNSLSLPKNQTFKHTMLHQLTSQRQMVFLDKENAPAHFKTPGVKQQTAAKAASMAPLQVHTPLCKTLLPLPILCSKSRMALMQGGLKLS